MLIKSLEEMEAIVKTNDALSWDGWTVLESKKSPVAWMKAEAAFVKDNWYAVNRYEPGSDGWDVPTKLVKKYAE